MARTRPALQNAVNEILIRHSPDGKRISFRQAERITGLSPATVGELAKGNARTPETIRRFAVGFGEDPTRLLLLAGFVPDTISPTAPLPTPENVLTPDERAWLERFGRALALLPPGPERDLWLTHLRQNTELLELKIFGQDEQEEQDEV